MSPIILLQVHLLVQDWEAGMDNAEVELDQCVSMWRNDPFDGVKVFHFLGMTGRIDIGELMEELRKGDLSKRALLSWAFAFLVVV